MPDLQRNNLIISLLRQFGHSLIVLVLQFRLLSGLLNRFIVPAALVLAGGEFFPEHIDVFAQSFILSLGHIEPNPFVIHILLGVGHLNLGLLLSELGRFQGFHVLISFFQFALDLLDLLLDNEEVALLVLESLGELVHFSLEPH